MDAGLKETLIGWAEEYNDPKYFQEDPIIFPTRFARGYEKGEAVLADVEIAALLSSHLAWGRRAMIVRDCDRMFEEMCWKPYDYRFALSKHPTFQRLYGSCQNKPNNSLKGLSL